MCQQLSQKRESYTFPSVIKYNNILENFDKIFNAIMHEFTPLFPDVLFPLELHLKSGPPARSSQAEVSNKAPTRRSGRSSSLKGRQKPHNAKQPANTEYTFMRIKRTEKEWKSAPLTDRDKLLLKPFVDSIIQCFHTPERFGIFRLSWKLKDKKRDKYDQPQYGGHVMPIVVDTEPTQGASSVKMIVLDVNGVGLKGRTYTFLDPDHRPNGGPNVLIKNILELICEHVAERQGISTWSVEFPEFDTVNVGGENDIETQEEGDAQHPALSNALYTGLSDGLCSIATLFVIIRLLCDQRRVLKLPINQTMARFINESSSYKHILFIRSFTFDLLSYFNMANPSNGIGGSLVTVTL